MNLDDWHLVFVMVCVILVLVACTPFVLANLPKRNEPFISLAVLGEEKTADHYYPDNNPNIEVGLEMNWTAYIYNHMGKAQYIALRIKLFNSTSLLPNSTSHTPSPSNIAYETRRILSKNETWLYSLSWSIENVSHSGEYFQINMISMNGENITTQVTSKNESIFWIALELWAYHERYDEFQFSWSHGNELRSVCNYFWFRVTSPLQQAK